MTEETALILWAAVGTLIAVLSELVTVAILLLPKNWRGLPWYEQARISHPLRTSPVVTVFGIVLILTWTEIVFFAVSPFRPSMQRLLSVQLIVVFGAIFVAMLASRFVAPRRSNLGYWLAGCCTSLLLRFPNTLVYTPMAIALIAFQHNLADIVVILVLGAIGIGFAAWGGGILVARLFGLARPALPRATNSANWAAERVGVRPSAVYEITWRRVTISAFVLSRFVVLSDSAAELFTDEQLVALFIREMTFFKQPLLTGFLRISDAAVIYFMLACTAIGAAVGGHAMLVGMITGFVAAYLMRPLYRRAQIKADALAAQADIEPAAALRALHQQYQLNLMPVVAASNRGSNPHLYDRMIAAGIDPGYPRPAPPSFARSALAVAAAMLTAVILSVVFIVGSSFLFA